MAFKAGQRRQAEESEARLRKGSPESGRANSDIQVNRSTEAGNKISIYRATKWPGKVGAGSLE